MSDLVGEPVEACYNFLSLYGSDGSCAIHMDAPSAKWTLDICIDQSKPWPIHFSELVPWPENWQAPVGGDWQEAIKSSHQFESHAMQAGEAIAFAGSSQWHYRNPMENASDDDFCTLLFFHFIPAGTSHFVYPRQWAEYFDIPELTEVMRRS